MAQQNCQNGGPKLISTSREYVSRDCCVFKHSRQVYATHPEQASSGEWHCPAEIFPRQGTHHSRDAGHAQQIVRVLLIYVQWRGLISSTSQPFTSSRKIFQNPSLATAIKEQFYFRPASSAKRIFVCTPHFTIHRHRPNRHPLGHDYPPPLENAVRQRLSFHWNPWRRNASWPVRN
jgi:hypothetical protein